MIGNWAACIVVNVSTLAGLYLESSCSAKLIAGGVNCSGQIISLRRFDKVSDEIKPHNVQNLTYKEQEIPQQSLTLEFQPSFIVKLLFITVLQWRGACFREQSKFFKYGNLFAIFWRAVNLQMNRTVKYQGAFSRIVGFVGKCSSSPLSLPLPFSLLPLQLSRYNSSSSACYSG